MPYSDKLLHRYMTLVTQPVSAQSYVGEDVRFSVEFEALESELGKAQSIHGEGPIDWAKVRQGSEMILQTRSKDLRVACWLSWALYQIESFPGLVAGCAMVSHLCHMHWDGFLPQKARTRSAAMSWFGVRLDQALGADIPVREQLPLFQKLEECLQKIDEAFTRELKDEAPLLLPLRRRLADTIQKAGEAETKPATVVAQVKQVAANLLAPAPPPIIDSEKEARRVLAAQEESARLLCAWWLRNKASDLRALRLNRAMAWLAIDKLPECDAQKITSLCALSAEKMKSHKERFAQERYADLIVDLEAGLVRTPFWLDGQYLLWSCFEALKSEAGMREVELQLSLFLKRLPGMAELRFQDGQPFADAATNKWISKNVTPKLEVQKESQKVEKVDPRPPWEVALDEAIPVLENDGVKGVAQLFKQYIQLSIGERAKFYWRLTLARVFHQAKKYELARIQLSVLDEQLKSDRLAAWEPDLNLEVLRLLYSCCEMLPQNTVVREYKDELYRRLCHLDIESVLE